MIQPLRLNSQARLSSPPSPAQDSQDSPSPPVFYLPQLVDDSCENISELQDGPSVPVPSHQLQTNPEQCFSVCEKASKIPKVFDTVSTYKIIRLSVHSIDLFD